MSTFRFKHFSVSQANSAMKVGTDAMVLGALIEVNKHRRALDIGAGTGVLSLMQAQKSEDLNIVAIELDENACRDARRNVADSPFNGRIQVVEDDFFQYTSGQLFDLIFSNPPYFNATYLPDDEQRALARHADFSFDRFFQHTATLLHPEGELWIILPVETFDRIVSQHMFHPLHIATEIQVWGSPTKCVRKVVRFTVQPTEPTQRRIVIRDASGAYTDDYKELTLEFHAARL